MAAATATAVVASSSSSFGPAAAAAAPKESAAGGFTADDIAAAAAAGVPVAAGAVAPFVGTWLKDYAASDAMDRVCALMGLSSLMAKAIGLIRGVELSVKGSQVLVGVFSVLTWFKLSERYAVDGADARNSRRDLRFGGMSGRLRSHPDAPDRLLLTMEWGDPCAGRGSDELSLHDGGDTLHVLSRCCVAAGAVAYLQVYRREGSAAAAALKAAAAAAPAKK